MPRLHIEIVNVGQSRDHFEIDVYSQRQPFLESAIIPAKYAPELNESFVMKLKSVETEPGETVTITSNELNREVFDFSKAFYYVPPERRGRWLVKKFAFGDESLLQKDGIV